MMDSYGDYATIYEAIGEGAFAAALAERILAALPASPARALDLACGTGAAALVFAAACATVVGLDRSPQMLAIARAKARDRGLAITFVEADLRRLSAIDWQGHAQSGSASSFSLQPSSFDLITCLYDSLNYLTGDGELAAAIEAAARLLAPRGRLVFDLNSEHEFAAWDDLDQVVHDEDGLLVYNRLSYDRSTRLASGRVVWFARDGATWRRGDETHHERAWSEAEVGAALSGAGLTLVARRTPAWEPAGPTAPRVVYEAIKEGRSS